MDRALRTLGDHLLTLLAVAGTLCIVLVLLSWLLNISLVMFRTGSMSPTISAGSLAVVREIPATEMVEGDVVTVDRGEGVLPVTHRVVGISDVDPATGEVTFTMRGDANDVEDPEPYTATTVQRVLLSVPGAARVIQWFGNPLVLGGLTLGATALVIWAFWPRDGEAGPGSVGPDGEDPDGEEAGSASPPRGSSVVHFLVLPLAAGLVLASPGTGHAETTLIAGEHLRIQTAGDPVAMKNLVPGRAVVWDVGVWAEAPEPGEIRLGIAGRGELAEIDGALRVSVRACPEQWRAGGCPSGAEELLEAESLDRLTATDPTRLLTTMPSDESRWLRIEVVLDGAEGPAAGADGDVLIHAMGAGEEITSGGEEPPSGDRSPSEGGGLARTGASGVLALLAAGLLSVALGIMLRRPACRGARR